MRRLFFAAFLALLTTASAVEFINPPPFGETGDFSLNTVYPEGSTINIRWTAGPDDSRTSLTMFQLNGTQFLQPFEYLTHSVLNVTELSWEVQTTKDLTLSNMFFFCLFIEGQSEAQANSHYFNISRKAVASSSTTSSSSATSSTQSSAPTGTTLVPASASAPVSSSTATGTPISAPTSASGGLSTGAKAGIGIGVASAVIIGLAAGWFLFGRQRKRENVYSPANVEPAMQQHQQQEYQQQQPQQPPYYEVSAQQKWEQERHQLSGDSAVYELPDSRR